MDYLLMLTCLFILGGSIFITLKLRFIQLRLFPVLFRMLYTSRKEEATGTISPKRALFTAMSTTLGISTIVAPIIAIHLGGPGALPFFLLTSFFGSAATFIEVNLCIEHRKKLPSGVIMGGPMQYMEKLLSPFMAKWYATACLLLMMAWSGAQANQLTAILDSPLLGNYRISPFICGSILAIIIFIILTKGIKTIGAISAKLIPVTFVLYIGASLWILLSNTELIGPALYDMFYSLISPAAVTSGSVVGGIVSTLRWGIFKGTQACEAGIGTQSIPHSMAETTDPKAQGALAMLSTYTAGLVAFLSGLVALVTKTWQDPDLPMGISMVAASFDLYFSSFGIAIIILSAFLFGFGTILGNSYNGGQCFAYLMDNKKNRLYLIGTTIMIFIGSTMEVKAFWSFMDLILVAVAVPHMSTLILHVAKKPSGVITLTRETI